MENMPEQMPAEQLVNLIDPDTQEVGSLPQSQVAEAMQQGFTPATSEEVHAFINKQKYGTPGQEALTALEGATSAATMGLIPGFGKKEDIRGRREESPILHGVGQMAGLVGSSALLPGGGAAGLLGRSGEAAAELVPEGLGLVSKLGSGAVKAATENMAFQAGDEVSRLMSEDPNQSVQTAVTNVGLAGLLGGGFGVGSEAVQPLWKATVGSKVSTLLKAISDKAGGIDNVLPDAIHDAVQTSGINLSPEVKAALSGDDNLKTMFSQLQESTTESGLKAQEALKNFKNQSSEAMVQALGKTSADVDSIANLSEYDAGKKIQQTLASELKQKIDPISKQYDEISNKFKDLELTKDRTIYQKDLNPYLSDEEKTIRGITSHGTTSEIAEKIGNLVQEKGYYTAPSSPEMQMINRIYKELPNLKTLEDLRNYQSLIGKNIAKEQLWDLGKGIRNVFAEAEESVLDKAVGEKSPDLLGMHGQAKAAYKDARGLIDDINSRLHVGKHGGPDTFLYALKEMSPEDVLRRLSGKGDADLLQILSQRFPDTAQLLKEFHVNNLLKSASLKAAPGEIINSKSLMNSISKMSPELKAFSIQPEAMQKIEALNSLLENLPNKMNPSGTAKTLDALWSKVPNSAMAMASMLTGHNPVIGYVVGELGRWLGRDIPDAVRLGILKFLGSNQPIESQGFKSMVDFISHTMKGENLINKSVKGVMKAGQEVLPQAFIPSKKETDKLDKQLAKLQLDPAGMFNVGGQTGHYMPDHQTSIGQYTANAVNYLNSQRPEVPKQSPLDSEQKPSPAQDIAYHRTLEIAQQPLVILNRIKEGTLTPKDVQDFNTLNPGLHEKLVQKLTNEMTDRMSKGDIIPYKLRMGLSLFMGQPLDSTMTPFSIQSTQESFNIVSPSEQPQRAKHSMTALNKIPGMYQTAGQSSEAQRLK